MAVRELPRAGTAEQAGAPVVVPWYLWLAVLAVTSAYVGGYWDISWHRSIGRDSFWTPPHVAMYACGVLAGIASAYLILSSTFGPAGARRADGVRIWGLSGPIGAFISAWGGMAMLVSAPFDDWWHNAYGLDVRIISPPHIVLVLGFFGILLGTVLLLLAFMNRAAGEARGRLQRLFLYAGGVWVSESLLVKIEYSSRSDMHNALFYLILCTGTPALLIAIGIASAHRWGCTIQAFIYTTLNLAFLWILPLFPAHPALGPVYREVTHFIPWEFPLLLIVPAGVTDVILQRTPRWRPLVRGLAIGAAFFASLVAVQWPFATFLMSPAARNWMFGAQYFDFSTSTAGFYGSYRFYVREPDPARFWTMAMGAMVMACLMAWAGLRIGRGMTRVQR